MSIVDDKRCAKCNFIKEAECFSIVPDNTRGSRLSSYCLDCQNIARNSRARTGHLWRTFKLTEEQYELMLKSQNGVCAICHLPEKQNKRLAIDHCHITGKICGLLCYSCNIGLGHFGHNVETLLSAIEYVKRTR